MSLARLLSAGKSLMTLRDTPTAYRMRRNSLLPQFGPVRNPFLPGEPVGQPPAGVSGAATPLPPSVKPPPPGVVGASQCPPPQGGSPAQPTTRPATNPAKLWRWLTRAKATGPAASATGLPRSAPPPAGKPPVQGELSLDSVKVVRNDLTDTDLIVRPAAGQGPVSQPWLEALQPEKAMDQLAARLCGTANR